MEDKEDAIARVLWINTDKMYKHAAQTYLEVKTNTKVRADEDDNSADFTTEKPSLIRDLPCPNPSSIKRTGKRRVRRLSAIFAKYPDIENSTVMLVVQTGTRYFVSSEGTKIVDSRPLIRVLAWAIPAPMTAWTWPGSETFDASTFDKLAPEQEMADQD